MTTQLPTQQGGEVDDGGPAFPFPVMHGKGASDGMSLRSYFAAHAPSPTMWWMESWASGAKNLEEVASVIAQWSFVYADAMIAARDVP